ncbi:MAG: ankyrin repeat domain-containing protein [Candidatus Sericytochromatia bacterium]|nr:ankyrin repeat domain-containing protein [Candidatus Sericytochromatia bacterium]
MTSQASRISARALRPVASLALAAALVVGLPGQPARADEAADQDLIVAVYSGNLRAMQEALRRGASFNARDENGYTPLHWAAFRGYVVLAGYMLDRGATVDVGDGNGYTPLMLAAWNGQDTVVRLLLSRGASRERLSHDGFTAYDYSVTQGHANLQPMLEPSRTVIAMPMPRAGRVGSSPPEDGMWRRNPRPPATPKLAAARPAPGTRHHVELVAGMHLSRVSFPIAGLHYRVQLHDWISLRLGGEYGRTRFDRTGPLDVGFMRLHSALLTNGPVYVGLGGTHVTLGTLWSGGYNPAVVVPEAITGVRLGWGALSGHAELRLGFEGPSTVTGGLGLRF